MPGVYLNRPLPSQYAAGMPAVTDPLARLPRPSPESIPAVVGRWPAALQLLWFRRYARDIAERSDVAWEDYYCSSTQHRGWCLPSNPEVLEVLVDGSCCFCSPRMDSVERTYFRAERPGIQL